MSRERAWKTYAVAAGAMCVVLAGALGSEYATYRRETEDFGKYSDVAAQCVRALQRTGASQTAQPEPTSEK